MNYFTSTGTLLLSTGVDYKSLRGTCWTLPSLAAALADTPDELKPLVRMKVRFRASRSPTRTARTVAIGAHTMISDTQYDRKR